MSDLVENQNVGFLMTWLISMQSTCADQVDSFLRLLISVQRLRDNSIVSGGKWPKVEIIHAFRLVLFTCKNEEGSVKNNLVRVATIFLPLKAYMDFSRRSRAGNSVHDRIWLKFKLI